MQFSIAERLRAFQGYYRKSNEAPLLGFFLGSEYPLRRYGCMADLPEGRPLRPSDFDPARFAKDSRRLFLAHEDCGGEFIWSASAFWGIPWLEALAGLDVVASHRTGSIYASVPAGYNPAGIAPFDPENPWARLCREFLEALAAESEGDFPLATTRVRGVSDLLSALYPGEEAVYRMIDEPEDTGRLCNDIASLIIDFSKFQLGSIPRFHGGMGTFYYNLWAPGAAVMIQEDGVALLSPRLFEQFIAGPEKRITTQLDGCIMHQHPVGYLAYEHYLNMDLNVMEMHRDDGGLPAESLAPVYLRILESKKLLVWGKLSDDDLAFLFRSVPPAGLAVCCAVESREQAEGIWNRYRQGSSK